MRTAQPVSRFLFAAIIEFALESDREMRTLVRYLTGSRPTPPPILAHSSRRSDMKRYTRPLIMIVLLASWSTVAGADVKTVTARQAGADATAAFRFKGVPAPSATDLGGKAKFSLLDGRADPNGAGLTVLNDGKLPTDDDQPA